MTEPILLNTLSPTTGPPPVNREVVNESLRQPVEEQGVSIPSDSQLTVKKVQSCLAVCMLIAEGLTLDPSLDYAATIATYSITFLSSSLESKQSWAEASTLNKVELVATVTLAAFGVVVAAAASSVLLLASVAAEVGVQAMTVIKCTYEQDYEKVLTSLKMMIINSFRLASLISGYAALWIVGQGIITMTTAYATGALAKKISNKLEALEVFCQAGLTLIHLKKTFILFDQRREVAVEISTARRAPRIGQESRVETD